VDYGQLAAAVVAALDDFDSPLDFEADDEESLEVLLSVDEPPEDSEPLDFLSPFDETLLDPARLSVR